MKATDIIVFLKSERMVLIGLTLIIFPLAFHTEQLFWRHSPFQDLTQSWLAHIAYSVPFAIAFEVAVVIFTVNGHYKKDLPKAYAFASFIINILYYEPWQLDLVGIVSTMLLSGVLSFTIYSYSELFVRRIDSTSNKSFNPDEIHISKTFENHPIFSKQAQDDDLLYQIEHLTRLIDEEREKPNPDEAQIKKWSDQRYRRKKKAGLI